MTRIETILYNARDGLADQRKDRWDDDVLLRALDEGQKDIAKQAEIFKDVIAVPLKTGQHTYNLPSDTLTIIRAVFRNTTLDIQSVNFMDSRGTTGRIVSSLVNSPASNFIVSQRNDHWMSAVTEKDICLVVYDQLNRHKLRVWPTPISTDLSESMAEFEDSYGFVASIDGVVINEDYGLIGSIYDTSTPVISLDNIEGTLVELVKQNSLVLYRTKAAKQIVSVTDELELDPCCDDALKHYVIGKVLRNDTNAQNRAKGNEELTFYDRELTRLKKIASSNSVSASHHNTTYSGMGD